MRPIFGVALLLSLAGLALPAPATAQCSIGWPIHKGCFNVGWQGCCTLKETQLGTITTLQWCENGFLCTTICNPFLDYYTAYCGWREFDPYTGNPAKYYDCTDNLYEEPTGTYPYLCDIPCGDVSPAGCCEGQTLLKYCKNGSLSIIDCSRNEDESFCGWDPVKQNYTCMKSPAAGPAAYPYACGTEPPVCEKKCGGKQCGDDGCGGVCGTCPAGQSCDNFGQCKGCTPQCAGKVCGPDGCGGQCGIPCGAGQACNPLGTGCECAKQCLGKDCGPDGCGGECGTCPDPKECSPAGICKLKPCAPSCDGKTCGDDGCGGACGACQPPKQCVWFQCVMPGEDPGQPPDLGAPDAASPGADGEEPAPCPDGMVRRLGACVPAPVPECPEGAMPKYGACVPIPPVDVPSGSSGCGAGAAPVPAGFVAALLAAAAAGFRSRRRAVVAAAVLLACLAAGGCLSSSRRTNGPKDVHGVEADAPGPHDPGEDADDPGPPPDPVGPGDGTPGDGLPGDGPAQPDLSTDPATPPDPGADVPACGESPFVSFSVEPWLRVGEKATFTWTLRPMAHAEAPVVARPAGFGAIAVKEDSVEFTAPADVPPDFGTTAITVTVTAKLGGCTDKRSATTKVLGNVWAAHDGHNAVELFRNDGKPFAGAKLTGHIDIPACVEDLGDGRIAVCNHTANWGPGFDFHPVEVFGTDGAHRFNFPIEDEVGNNLWKNAGAESLLVRPEGRVWVGDSGQRILVFSDGGGGFLYDWEFALGQNQSAKDLVALPDGNVLVVFGNAVMHVVDADGNLVKDLTKPADLAPALVATHDPIAGGLVVGGLIGDDGFVGLVPLSGGFGAKKVGPLADGWYPKHAIVPFGEGFLAILTNEGDIRQKAVLLGPDLVPVPGAPFLPEDFTTWRALMVLGGN
ncbi:MAG: hypothetical protein FJ087_06185 [Deltaproteobacteria bacterium]|nr:hypothetical protein [Deltaproteobacteria bacterium]